MRGGAVFREGQWVCFSRLETIESLLDPVFTHCANDEGVRAFGQGVGDAGTDAQTGKAARTLKKDYSLKVVQLLVPTN